VRLEAGQDDAYQFSAQSRLQLQHLLFAPCNKGGSKPPKNADLDIYEWDYPAERNFKVKNLSEHIKPGGTRPLATADMKLIGLGIPPISFTSRGVPSAEISVLRKLAGPDPSSGNFGEAYTYFSKQGKK